MNQEKKRPTRADPRWSSIKAHDAIGCYCCKTGFSHNYLMDMSNLLKMALSHDTYRPRAYA